MNTLNGSSEPAASACAPKPLHGVRVIEFCHTVMGPVCGLVLGDLGADVIKVEAMPNGDRTRRLSGFGTGFFSFYNRNKRSILVDIKSESGRSIVERLVGEADVFIENYGPGTLDRMGFGSTEATRINPAIVYCSLKGFLSGPYERRPALDEIAQYMTGLAYMTGPLGRPMRAGASVVDITGGIFGVVAILTALFERSRTGKGNVVRSSLFESAAFLMGQHMAVEAFTGERVQPMSVQGAGWAIYESFIAADHVSVFVAITSDKHWQSFCAAFDAAYLGNDPTLHTNEGRLAARARLRPIVAEIFAVRQSRDLMAVLEREDIPFAPLAQPGDLFNDVHLRTGHLVQTTLANGNEANLPGLPLEYDGASPDLTRQPPKAGEHTLEILREIGISDELADDFLTRGVVATSAASRAPA